MTLPAWDSIVADDRWRGLSDEHRRTVYQKYLGDIGQLKEWQALDDEQKRKVISRMQQDAGWHEEPPTRGEMVGEVAKEFAESVGRIPSRIAKAVPDPFRDITEEERTTRGGWPLKREPVSPKREPYRGAQKVTFDPEGAGYDYDTATAAGDKPDETGHMGSLDPRTGMVLKGRRHSTWDKMVEAEQRRGNQIVKRGNRYYSVPKERGLPEGTPRLGDSYFLHEKQTVTDELGGSQEIGPGFVTPWSKLSPKNRTEDVKQVVTGKRKDFGEISRYINQLYREYGDYGKAADELANMIERGLLPDFYMTVSDRSFEDQLEQFNRIQAASGPLAEAMPGMPERVSRIEAAREAEAFPGRVPTADLDSLSAYYKGRPPWEELEIPVGDPVKGLEYLFIPFQPAEALFTGPGALTEADFADPDTMGDAIDRAEASIANVANMAGQAAARLFPGGFSPEAPWQEYDLNPQFAGILAEEAARYGITYPLYARLVANTLWGLYDGARIATARFTYSRGYENYDNARRAYRGFTPENAQKHAMETMMQTDPLGEGQAAARAFERKYGYRSEFDPRGVAPDPVRTEPTVDPVTETAQVREIPQLSLAKDDIPLIRTMYQSGELNNQAIEAFKSQNPALAFDLQDIINEGIIERAAEGEMPGEVLEDAERIGEEAEGEGPPIISEEQKEAEKIRLRDVEKDRLEAPAGVEVEEGVGVEPKIYPITKPENVGQTTLDLVNIPVGGAVQFGDIRWIRGEDGWYNEREPQRKLSAQFFAQEIKQHLDALSKSEAVDFIEGLIGRKMPPDEVVPPAVEEEIIAEEPIRAAPPELDEVMQELPPAEDYDALVSNLADRYKTMLEAYSKQYPDQLSPTSLGEAKKRIETYGAVVDAVYDEMEWVISEYGLGEELQSQAKALYQEAEDQKPDIELYPIAKMPPHVEDAIGEGFEPDLFRHEDEDPDWYWSVTKKEPWLPEDAIVNIGKERYVARGDRSEVIPAYTNRAGKRVKAKETRVQDFINIRSGEKLTMMAPEVWERFRSREGVKPVGEQLKLRPVDMKSIRDLPPPYGLTREELEAAGGDTLRALEARRKSLATKPIKKDFKTWNTKNKKFGQAWSEVKADDKRGGFRVVAGLEGNTAGVDVAHFYDEGAAERFSRDFKEGRNFALENHDEWLQLIDGADNAKSLNAELRDGLLARARKEGLTLEGERVDLEELKAQYEEAREAKWIPTTRPEQDRIIHSFSYERPSPLTDKEYPRKPERDRLGITKEYDYVYYSYNRPVSHLLIDRDIPGAKISESGRFIFTKEPIPMEQVYRWELGAVYDKTKGVLAKEYYDAMYPDAKGYEFFKDMGKGKWQGVVIHKSSKYPGKFQATYFDERGFIGDSEFEDEIAAIGEYVGQGYNQPMPGLLDDAAADPQFLEGIQAVEEAQKEHAKRMKEISEKAKEKPSGTPLKEITVQARAIRGKTGEIIKVEKDAETALRDIDEMSSIYQQLLECLKS